MRFEILEIYEEDHGCEGLLPGEELMDEVYVRGEDGKTQWLRIPDRIAQSYQPGDIIEQ